MNRIKLNKKNGNSKKKMQKIEGGSTIPRSLTSGYPSKFTVTKLRFAPAVSLLPAVPYDSINLRNSTFQTISTVSSVYAGLTNLALRYSQATVLKMKVKATVINKTGVTGVICTLFPSRVPTTDHTTSYFDKRQAPEARILTLAAYNSQFGTKGSFSHVVDFSRLWGYNISTTNNSSFIHNLGSSAPSVISSMEFMVQSIDAATVPSVDVQFDCELDVMLQSPTQPLN